MVGTSDSTHLRLFGRQKLICVSDLFCQFKGRVQMCFPTEWAAAFLRQMWKNLWKIWDMILIFFFCFVQKVLLNDLFSNLGDLKAHLQKSLNPKEAKLRNLIFVSLAFWLTSFLRFFRLTYTNKNTVRFYLFIYLFITNNFNKMNCTKSTTTLFFIIITVLMALHLQNTDAASTRR